MRQTELEKSTNLLYGDRYILYFITATPDSPLPDLINRLTTHYNPLLLPSWSLRQRLFRSTPTSPGSSTVNDENTSTSPRFLQIVSLPDYPNDSLVAITSISHMTSVIDTSPDPVANIISIPAGPSTDEFTQLLITKLGPLWQQRQPLAIFDGSAFEIGDFRVRAGELRQGTGGAQQIKGVVAEITYMSQGGGKKARGGGDDMIRAFWTELDMKGAKEFADGGLGGTENGFDSSNAILSIGDSSITAAPGFAMN
ncbi:MAG: hypothetical protein Q9170_005138 [Blastenia crenularia]